MKLSTYFSGKLLIKNAHSLQRVRENILRVLLYFATFIGGIIYIFALIPVIKQSLFAPALLYSLYYFVLIWITFSSRLSYQVRAYSWILILYFLGMINLVYSGLNVDAGLFFMTHVIMAALLLGLDEAIFALFLSLLGIAIAGFQIVGGDGVFTIGLPQTDPVLWLVGGTILLLIGLVSAISVGALIDGLGDNLDRLSELSATLAIKNEYIKKSELNYRILVETSPDVIIRIDLVGKIVAINPAGERLLGLSKYEILEMKISEFVQPDEQLTMNQILEEVMRKGVLRNAELQIRSFSGKVAIVEFSIATILEDNDTVVGYIAIGDDVTEKKVISELVHKQNEDLIQTQDQLRKLARRLILAQEEERRVISRELHDDAGQILVTLQHNLGNIIEECQGARSVVSIKEQLHDTLNLVRQAASTVRLSSHRLRPPVLEVGGLWVSLEELCENISSQSRIEINLTGEPIDGISDGLAINLYRFVQEAITNSLKHSDANRVFVNISHDDHKMIISVVDNGLTPVDLEKLQDRHSGIGLLGLQERLAPFHGKIETFLEDGHGFAIRAIVPWENN